MESLFWKYNQKTAIRENKWKLVDNKFLFNLKDDPNEKVDLSEKYPELVNNMRKRSEEFFQKIEE